jgi:ribokinase
MIFVLGSLNMDYAAAVVRLPEKGETVLASEFNCSAGGKGLNQAVAAAKLGGDVSMIGKAGGDENGKTLVKTLRGYGVKDDFVSIAPDKKSGTAMIAIQGGDNRIIVAKGANGCLSGSDAAAALKTAKKGDILLCQLEIPVAVVEYAFTEAKKKGMLTVLNPAPAAVLSDSLYKNTDIIAPNETETEALTGIDPADILNTALAVKEFYKKGVKNVVITLGARGSVVSEGQTLTEIDCEKVKAKDTTAAGDTYIGALCARLSKGDDIVAAARYASRAAGITVQRKGAAESIPTEAELCGQVLLK